jgi:uncharacterized membrane protein
MSDNRVATLDPQPAPGWLYLVIPPLLFPLAAMAWLRSHWAEIPERFPVHWGTHGADRWASRTLLHVYAFPLFGEGVTLVMLGVALVTYFASRRADRASSSMAVVFLAVMYLVSLVFTAVALGPLKRFPAWTIPLMVIPVVLFILAMVAIQNFRGGGKTEVTPAECWSVMGTYYNPLDPALFVQKRFGVGYTLNFAHPWSKPFLWGTVGSVLALTGFLIWALR